jgi:hypothetical protein
VPYQISAKQIEAVLALDSLNRFKHFVSKVADWQKLWGVKNEDGWLVPVAPENFEYFPLWPHPEYAQKCAAHNFPGNHPTEISLDDLMNHWLPRLQADDVKIAVFPNMEMTFWCIEPDELNRVCSEELTKYE